MTVELTSYNNSEDICYTDWSAVFNLCYAYFYEMAALKYGKTKTLSQSEWTSPSTWGKSDYVVYDVPWSYVAKEASLTTRHYIKNRLKPLSTNNPTQLRKELNYIQNQLPRVRKQVKTRIRRASDKSLRNLSKAIGVAEDVLWGAEFVRNRSVDALLLGSVFLSGGAALAVLGTGATLDGFSSYQDTGNVGAAIFKGTGSFVMGSIGIGLAGGPTATLGQKGVVLFLGATFDATQALVDGKTGTQALVSAGLGIAGNQVGDMGGDAIERFLKTPEARRMLAKSSVIHRIPMAWKTGLKSKTVVGRGTVASSLLKKYMVDTPIDAGKGKLIDALVQDNKRAAEKKSTHKAVPLNKPMRIGNKTITHERTATGGKRVIIQGPETTLVQTQNRPWNQSKSQWYTKSGRRINTILTASQQARVEAALFLK